MEETETSEDPKSDHFQTYCTNARKRFLTAKAIELLTDSQQEQVRAKERLSRADARKQATPEKQQEDREKDRILKAGARQQAFATPEKHQYRG